MANWFLCFKLLCKHHISSDVEGVTSTPYAPVDGALKDERRKTGETRHNRRVTKDEKRPSAEDWESGTAREIETSTIRLTSSDGGELLSSIYIHKYEI